jgi:hypothetical protein
MADSIGTTQNHLDIKDVRNDLVILRNGNVGLVLETTALNFDLLSEDEQDARILAFAALMNSVTFPIQIMIHTERTDVTNYIEKLQEVQSRQTSQALIKQIEIYMRFVKNLTINNEVLNKRFFVVIPAIFNAVEKPSIIKSLFGSKQQLGINIDRMLSKAQLELYPKRDHLVRLLKKMGISSRQLTTDELIRLYYTMYDPDKIGASRLGIYKANIQAGMILSEEKSKEDGTV